MAKLKRLSPELSKLCAQVVHQRHKDAAMRETAELRALLAEMMRRGRSPKDLMVALLTGDMSRLSGPPAATPGTTTKEGIQNGNH